MMPIDPRFVETVPRRGYRFIAPVHRDQALAATAAAVARLVVLPFSNLSDDSGQEYFADGLDRGADRAARPAVPRQGGRHRAVVVDGLQRQPAARPRDRRSAARGLFARRQRAQAMALASASRPASIETASEAELWSRTYERTACDWLDVQADVAGLVARSLMQELVPGRASGKTGRRASGRVSGVPARPLSLGQAGRQRVGGIAARVRRSDAPGARLCRGAWRTGPRQARQRGVLPRRCRDRRSLPRARSALRALELDPTVSEAHGCTRRYASGCSIMDWAAAETGYLHGARAQPEQRVRTARSLA